MEHEVIIIGAGLSGLTAANLLRQEGKEVLVLEAAERIGGRLCSVPSLNGKGYFELGATWFGKKHRHLNRLLEEVGLQCFEQYEEGLGCYEATSFLPVRKFVLPDDMEPSFRIKGSSEHLIHRLADLTGRERIRTGVHIKSIEENNGRLSLGSADGRYFEAPYVLSTIPPKLLEYSVHFFPALPFDLRAIMQNMHTWMSHSVKFYVEYDRPYWRETGYAGFAMSQNGLIQELHDHSSFDETAFSLMGFLSQTAHFRTSGEREKLVKEQLQRLFGAWAAHYLRYMEKAWPEEPLTSTPEVEFININPGYGHPAFREPQMGGRLLISGTETSPVFGGYMDGAVYAGMQAAKWVGRKSG